MKRNLQKYSQILESLHEGIWILDEDANTILVNSRMAEMLGYTVDEMLGKPIFSFLDEYDTVIAARALERRKQGVREQFEHQLLCRDGTLIHTLFEASPMYDDEGNYAGSIAGVVDITERKQLEEALRESEERYRDLSENANDLIQSVTPDGRFLYVNKTWREVLGYSEEEVADLTLWDIIHPDSIPRCKEVFQKVFSGETVSNVEAVFAAKDGKLVTVEGNINCRYEEGKAVASRGIFRDITERKRAEEALRESERHYRLLAENAKDAIWTVDMNMRPTYMSPSITYLLGYTVEEAMAKPMEAVYTPASFEIAMKVLAKEFALENMEQKDLSRSRTVELELNRKDGSIVLVEGNFSFIRGPDGRPVGILAIARDITERKQAEEALLESERHYRLLADNVTDIIFTMDMNLRYTYVSPSVTRLSGYSVEEATSHTLQEVLTPASFEVAMKTFAEEKILEHMEENDPTRSRTLELELNRKDGSTFWAEVQLTTLRDHDGHPIEFVGVARDISKLRKGQ